MTAVLPDRADGPVDHTLDHTVNHATEPAVDAAAELAQCRAALRAIADVCRAAACGDLEPRVPVLGDDPDLLAVREALNGLLDLTDAYVRESSASLSFASDARFYRRFLVRGMRGSFRSGAETINEAIATMAGTHDELVATDARRLELADGFERAVLGLSDQVAAASAEMEASSRSLAATAEDTAHRTVEVGRNSEAASHAVTVAAAAVEQLVSTVRSIEEQADRSNEAGARAVVEADQVRTTVQGLSSASQEIGAVVGLINQVASQTRLLALNATIEAARAGESGKGFAVVASEVKNLASETAEATSRIEQQVGAIQTATSAAVAAIESIADAVTGMGESVATISGAVHEQRAAVGELSRTTTDAAGSVTVVGQDITAISGATEQTSAGATEMTSASLELARLATELRTHVAGFLEQIR